MTTLKKILAIKHIILLDALLIALCLWMGVGLRRQWLANAAVYQVSRIVAPSVAMKQAVAKQKSAEALRKNYMVIASRNLFSPDRNDQIAREDIAKVRPPKPVLFGVINLKDAKLAMMSSPGSRDFRSLKVGDKIGEYTLTRILPNKVELLWGSETVETTTEEQPRTIPAPVAPVVGGGAGGKVVSVSGSEGGASSASASGPTNAAPAQPPAGQGPCKGHWVKTLFGMVCSEDSK
ncbi:MAG: hypothetical protein LAO31_05430 [Acidobacteriia bacterium]|nr:hypothetical protein [Terriglobia bacterium]